MEKNTPHCKLPIVKAMIEYGKVRTTNSARSGADALNLDLLDMLAVILALRPMDFYRA